ncbi:hypothetical protein HDU85_001263 [Gaertneriomyces sp. JEL0708]|nr:hypothetical protein HDU85_001263 [Gaertneriomyces sp. JEL0708]
MEGAATQRRVARPKHHNPSIIPGFITKPKTYTQPEEWSEEEEDRPDRADKLKFRRTAGGKADTAPLLPRAAETSIPCIQVTPPSPPPPYTPVKAAPAVKTEEVGVEEVPDLMLVDWFSIHPAIRQYTLIEYIKLKKSGYWRWGRFSGHIPSCK